MNKYTHRIRAHVFDLRFGVDINVDEIVSNT